MADAGFGRRSARTPVERHDGRLEVIDRGAHAAPPVFAAAYVVEGPRDERPVLHPETVARFIGLPRE